MAGPEMKVHKWFKESMEKRFGDNFSYIKPPSGMYSSRRGISDFVFCLYGIFCAVEVKSDESKSPTMIQENYLCEIKTAGGVGECLQGKNEKIFDLLLDLVKEKYRHPPLDLS